MDRSGMEGILELSVVIPTYNESANVGPLLQLLETALAGISYEVVFVDDDSPDGTAERVRALARQDRRVRVLKRIGRSGLSTACVEGMLASAAPYIAVMDADLQHDERILPEMLRKARAEELDIVVASRNLQDGGMGQFSRERVALSGWGRKLSEAVTGKSVTDPMSGFFLLKREFLDETAHALSGMGFKILVDLLASARRPVRIGEVPYVFRNRVAGESKLDILVMVEYAQLLIDKLTGGILPPRLWAFSAVGLVGVTLHLMGVAVLYRLCGVDFPSAYLTATLVAMTSNFFLNNAITYRDCRFRNARGLLLGWLSFCLACSLGAVISYGIANAFRTMGAHWAAASLLGILLGAVWNYLATQMFTWQVSRRRRRRRLEHYSPRASAPAALGSAGQG